MNSFLLDTCAVSETAKNKPNRGFTAWYAEHQKKGDQFFLSILSLAELKKGMWKHRDAIFKNKIEKFVAALEDSFEGKILDIQLPQAYLWGQISALTELNGNPIQTVDRLIAATAIHFGLVVVTRNDSDFKPVAKALHIKPEKLILNPWT